MLTLCIKTQICYFIKYDLRRHSKSQKVTFMLDLKSDLLALNVIEFTQGHIHV